MTLFCMCFCNIKWFKVCLKRLQTELNSNGKGEVLLMEQVYQLTLFLQELNADIDNITYFAPNIYATDEQIIYFFLMHLTQLKLFEMHYQILTQEKGQGKQCFFMRSITIVLSIAQTNGQVWFCQFYCISSRFLVYDFCIFNVWKAF